MTPLRWWAIATLWVLSFPAGLLLRSIGASGATVAMVAVGVGVAGFLIATAFVPTKRQQPAEPFHPDWVLPAPNEEAAKADLLVISKDGCPLVRITTQGEAIYDPADLDEAARIFWDHLARMMPPGLRSEAS